MKNNKGQALIEFTLILPVILIILLYVVELTRITLKKYELESNLDLIVTLYQEKKQEELNNYINQNNINITYTKQNELTTITINKNTNSNLPIIKNNLGKIETKRTIYEKE